MTDRCRIIIGDARTALGELPEKSVRCCVTSPPYWGLRDYGVAGQIGLEPTPEAWVAEMIAVFGQVRRVLADDGTLWVNVGDAYCGSGPPGGAGKQDTNVGSFGCIVKRVDGVKPKDLIGLPWMLAFALRADGWYLRSDIIWHKPNPMPESVTDRPTKAHEYIFLFAKGQYRRRSVELADLRNDRLHLRENGRTQSPDAWAGDIGRRLASAILDCTKIKEQFGGAALEAQIGQQGSGALGGDAIASLPPVHRMLLYASRLARADVSPKEFLRELHSIGFILGEQQSFLIRGVDAKIPLPPGVSMYGKTSVAVHDAGKIGEFDFLHGRIIAHTPTTCSYYFDAGAIAEEAVGDPGGNTKPTKGAGDEKMRTRNGLHLAQQRARENGGFDTRNARTVWTITTQGYKGAHFATFPRELAARCIKAGSAVGDLVLDPFLGTGTTIVEAVMLGRRGVGTELNPEYARLARKRIDETCPLLAHANGPSLGGPHG